MSVEDLYSEFILYHYKNSPYKGVLEDATNDEEGKNLSCGDQIHVYVKFNDNKIETISFDGHGCAISMASASVMAETLSGKSVEEARLIIEEFFKMLKGENHNLDILGDAAIFDNVKRFPMRVKCASLAWRTLERIIDKREQKKAGE